MKQKSLLRMMQTVDAFFPIGAFTLSNGLEDYVVREKITSSLDLKEYLEGFLQIFPYNDLGIASLAYQYEGKHNEILQLDGLTNAMKSALEIRNGSIKMCSRYLKARQAINDCNETLKWYMDEIKNKNAIGFHPIAVGIYGASIGIEIEEMLSMYGYSVLSAIVNNGVKLVPLSQMDGQKILFNMIDLLEKAVDKSKNIRLEELGVSGSAFEIHCMNHEHLYSRQFMS